jgi:hypothetical protein
MWNSGQYFGCEFHAPLAKAAVSAALLRNPIAQSLPEFHAADDDSEIADARYPLGVRLRVILGASIALWALILWAVGII